MAKYGIDDRYRENVIQRGGQYEWTPTRVQYSASYQWQIYRWAAELVRERGLRTVVDVGCGPGIKLNELIAPVAERVIGIDQVSSVDYCKRTYERGSYLVDDLENPTLALGLVPDLVLCIDVIEHLTDPDGLLRYFRQLAGEATLFLVSTPDRERLRGRDSWSSPNPDHVREWTARELANYLEQNGFAIVEHKHFPPVRMRPNLITAAHFVRQLLPGRSWLSNQAVLFRMDGGQSR